MRPCGSQHLTVSFATPTTRFTKSLPEFDGTIPMACSTRPTGVSYGFGKPSPSQPPGS